MHKTIKNDYDELKLNIVDERQLMLDNFFKMLDNRLDLLDLNEQMVLCKSIDTSLFLFDGKNWTGNFVKTSADDQRLISEFSCQDDHESWFQLTVIYNSRKERCVNTIQ